VGGGGFGVTGRGRAEGNLTTDIGGGWAETVLAGAEGVKRDERMQKGIAYWDKQNHAVPAPNCVLKVRGEVIKVEGL